MGSHFEMDGLLRYRQLREYANQRNIHVRQIRRLRDRFNQGGKRLGDETGVSEQKGVMQWTGIELGTRPKFKIQRSKFKILIIY